MGTNKILSEDKQLINTNYNISWYELVIKIYSKRIRDSSQ